MFRRSGFQVTLGISYIGHTRTLVTQFVDYRTLCAFPSLEASTVRLKGRAIEVAGAVHFFKIFNPPHQFGCYVAAGFLTDVREFMI
jgi:hypothetical protein